METDRLVQIVAVAAMLLLVVRGLTGRGLGFGRGLSLAITWVVIFVLAFLIFSFRDEFRPMIDRMGFEMDPSRPELVGESLRIPMADDGHFWVRGLVNGHETRFLIDSGATMTALSHGAARAAGIDTDAPGLPVLIDTANGTVRARRVRIAQLELGTIGSADLRAITAAEFGSMNVLGMNFLSSLSSWGVEGRTLVLRP